LYVKIADNFDVVRAGKITGMLLEANSLSELKELIISESKLKEMVNDAISILDGQEVS
jgi:hypothetical protein